jgi:magnesium transporter
MIRSILFTTANELQHIPTDQIETVLGKEEGFIWVDISSETEEACKPLLRDVFKFHPLSIDDALQETHVPKVDQWETYLYMALRTVKTDPNDTLEIHTPELDIFLGATYLITYHEEPIAAVEKVWELCHQDNRYLSRGTGYLLYHIADEIVTNTMLVIDNLDIQIDQIEDEIFITPQSGTLELIFSVKRVVLKLRRMLLHQREVFNKLSRGDFALIQEEYQVYFRDIYDHMVRLQEINESSRDLISGALDTYLSVVNNRMNEVMKTLTIITTLFMPLSFLTGFFGMNFFQPAIPLGAWTGKEVFIPVLIGIIIIPVGMYFWMRRRAWM